MEFFCNALGPNCFLKVQRLRWWWCSYKKIFIKVRLGFIFNKNQSWLTTLFNSVILNLMQSGWWWRDWLFLTWCSQVGDSGVGYSQPDAVRWVMAGLVILNLMQSGGWRRVWLFSTWCSQVGDRGVGCSQPDAVRWVGEGMVGNSQPDAVRWVKAWLVILNLMQSGGWRHGW